MLKHSGLILIFCSLASIGLAQWGNFTFQRPLNGIEDTWHRIEFPNEFFRQAQPGLSDLRIKGITPAGDTIEAPYVLEWPESGSRIAPETFEIINPSRRNGIFYATLVATNTDPVNRIILDLENPNFDWRITLEGSQDQREWFTVLDRYRILAFNDPFGVYNFSTLHFPASSYKYYRLSIPTEQQVELTKAYRSYDQAIPVAYRSYPISSQSIRESPEKQRTEIHIDLPWPVPVSYLEMPVQDSFDFYRPIRIELLTDSTKTEKGWTYRYPEVYRGTLSSLEEPVFTFPMERTHAIRVYITHHDNPPLRLGPLQVKGLPPVLKVRFTEPADYYLLYGDPEVSPPHYDLAKFASKIPEDASLLTLGPEVRLRPGLERPEPLFTNQAWLWGLLIVMIGMLGWFSLRMLRDGGNET